MPHTARTFEPERIIQPIYTGGDTAVELTGEILASCVGGDTLLTNIQSGACLGRIEGDGEALTALLLTPSASHLITCSRSLSMRIYSLEKDEATGTLLAVLQRSLKHTSPVVSANIDSTGKILATGGSDGVIKVWDIRGGYVSHTFRGHTGVISTLHFFQVPAKATDTSKKRPWRPQDQDAVKGETIISGLGGTDFYLASGGEDGKIRIWDLVKRKAITSLDSHVSVVRGLAFSPEQKALVSGSRDRTAIIWDTEVWKPRRTVPVLEVIESAGFVCQGKFFYTGGESGRLRIWDVDSGREVTSEEPSGNEGDGIVQIMHIPNRSSLLTVQIDQTFLIRSTEPLSKLEPNGTVESLPIIRRVSGTHDEIIDMAFVSKNCRMMALATNSESIRLVSVPIDLPNETTVDQEKQYFGADIGILQGHSEIVICLDVDWSGCWLATGAKDNTARLWRIDQASGNYECYAIFKGHAESIGAISLPKNPPAQDSAAYLEPHAHPPSFILTGSQDKTIKRWNIMRNSAASDDRVVRAIFTKKAHDKDINAMDINQNASLFASASQDKLVKVWSTEEGETQGILRGHKRGVWSVKFSPKEAPTINGHSGSTKVGCGFALTGSGDRTVKIWSLFDYSCLRTMEGHTSSILKVLWKGDPHPDSELQNKRTSLVASAGGDGLVKVWDASSGECVTTLDNHEDRVWALVCNQVTGHLVSGGGDGIITFWADTTATTAAAAAAASAERIEQEQMLQSHVHHGNYREAIVLALQLNHPARLLALFSGVIKKQPPEENSLSGVKAVDDVLTSLTDEQLYKLLLRLRDWNTNARTAPVAQRILWVVVKSYQASKLVELRKNGRGLGAILNGLKVYTERHYQRLEELLEESYVVDFMVRSMEESGFISNGTAVNSRIGDTDVIMV